MADIVSNGNQPYPYVARQSTAITAHTIDGDMFTSAKSLSGSSSELHGGPSFQYVSQDAKKDVGQGAIAITVGPGDSMLSSADDIRRPNTSMAVIMKMSANKGGKRYRRSRHRRQMLLTSTISCHIFDIS